MAANLPQLINPRRPTVSVRKVILFVAAILVSGSSARAQSAVLSTDQVITAAELRASGITRLSNILLLVDGARYSTIDGFTVVPSFSGLAPLQDRVWSIEVDGLPMESGILDVQNLNALSVPVSSIDSVVVSSTPRVRLGRFRPGGTIQIFTRRTTEASTYHVRGSISAVNETGDPGPFRYADPDVGFKNVDKEGPDVSLDMGFRDGGTAIATGGVFQQIIPSDAAVFERNYRAFDTPRTPEMVVFAPFVTFMSDAFGIETVVRASGATFDDMLYSREIAREVPVRYERLGLAGYTRSLGDGGYTWRTEWDWSTRQVRNDPGATRIPLNWSEQSGSFGASVSVNARRFLVTGGMSASFLEARSAIGSGFNERVVTPRIYGAIEATHNKVAYGIDAFVASDRTGVGAGGAARMDVSLSPDHDFTAFAVIAQTLPSESNPMAFWAHHGLSLIADTEVSVLRSEWESRSASLDLAWQWKAGERTRVVLNSFGRRFAGLRYADREIVADDIGFVVSSRSYRGAWGSTIGVGTAVRTQLGLGLYSLTFNYQTVMSGNQLFYDAYNTIPRRQLRLEAVHSVGDRFSIKNAVFHYSSSSWGEFLEVAAETDYSDTVPGFVRWDISVSKKLARDRVELSAAVENVLNNHVGFHPIGATFDRALRVQMTVAFD